jgi:hypothetical protein
MVAVAVRTWGHPVAVAAAGPWARQVVAVAVGPWARQVEAVAAALHHAAVEEEAVHPDGRLEAVGALILRLRYC